MKSTFISDIILLYYNLEQLIMVETDALNYVSTKTLLQFNFFDLLWIVVSYSKKHSQAKCNYKIYDKELMTIIRAFEYWCPKLEKSGPPIKVITDHKNLEYFMTTK